MDDLRQLIADNHTEVIQRVTALEATLVDVPERVQKLEKWRSYLTGAWAVLAGTFIYVYKAK